MIKYIKFPTGNTYPISEEDAKKSEFIQLLFSDIIDDQTSVTGANGAYPIINLVYGEIAFRWVFRKIIPSFSYAETEFINTIYRDFEYMGCDLADFFSILLDKEKEHLRECVTKRVRTVVSSGKIKRKDVISYWLTDDALEQFKHCSVMSGSIEKLKQMRNVLPKNCCWLDACFNPNLTVEFILENFRNIPEYVMGRTPYIPYHVKEEKLLKYMTPTELYNFNMGVNVFPNNFSTFHEPHCFPQKEDFGKFVFDTPLYEMFSKLWVA